MASRALVLHKKESTTAGGLTSKKLTVSKSSGEIVSKAKAKQGKGRVMIELRRGREYEIAS